MPTASQLFPCKIQHNYGFVTYTGIYERKYCCFKRWRRSSTSNNYAVL